MEPPNLVQLQHNNVEDQNVDLAVMIKEQFYGGGGGGAPPVENFSQLTCLIKGGNDWRITLPAEYAGKKVRMVVSSFHWRYETGAITNSLDYPCYLIIKLSNPTTLPNQYVNNNQDSGLGGGITDLDNVIATIPYDAVTGSFTINDQSKIKFDLDVVPGNEIGLTFYLRTRQALTYDIYDTTLVNDMTHFVGSYQTPEALIKLLLTAYV